MRDTGFSVPPPAATGWLSPLPATRSPARASPDRRGRAPVFESAGGGLVSTAADYARFLQLMLGRGTVHTHRQRAPGQQRHGGLHDRRPPRHPAARGHHPARRLRFLTGCGGAPGRGRRHAASSAGHYSWSGMGGTFFFVDPAQDLFAILLTQGAGAAGNAVRTVPHFGLRRAVNLGGHATTAALVNLQRPCRTPVAPGPGPGAALEVNNQDTFSHSFPYDARRVDSRFLSALAKRFGFQFRRAPAANESSPWKPSCCGPSQAPHPMVLQDPKISTSSTPLAQRGLVRGECYTTASGEASGGRARPHPRQAGPAGLENYMSECESGQRPVPNAKPPAVDQTNPTASPEGGEELVQLGGFCKTASAPGARRPRKSAVA